MVKGEQFRNFLSLVEGETEVLSDLIVKEQTGDRAEISKEGSSKIESSM